MPTERRLEYLHMTLYTRLHHVNKTSNRLYNRLYNGLYNQLYNQLIFTPRQLRLTQYAAACQHGISATITTIINLPCPLSSTDIFSLPETYSTPRLPTVIFSERELRVHLGRPKPPSGGGDKRKRGSQI